MDSQEWGSSIGVISPVGVNETTGWWYTDNAFTLSKFLSLMVMYEMNGRYDGVDLFIQVVSNHLFGDASKYGGESLHCSSATCVNGDFNSISQHLESAQKEFGNEILAGVHGDGSLLKITIDIMEMAQRIGGSILNPDDVGYTFSLDGPY